MHENSFIYEFFSANRATILFDNESCEDDPFDEYGCAEGGVGVP